MILLSKRKTVAAADIFTFQDSTNGEVFAEVHYSFGIF